MIEVRSLNFAYNNDRAILERIAFDAEAGQCVAVLGNNGAGKSTLIKCLNHILEPRSGVVRVDGTDISALKRLDIAKRVAYVAQKNASDRITVFDSVLLGRKPYIAFDPSQDDLTIVSTVIDRLGLESLSLRYLDELSGGELQKVMLARALAQRPRVLLLDEPTSNLDLRNQHEVLEIVQQIAREESISVILVIHDLNLALRYCDRFLFVKDGGVYAYGGMEVMKSENISSVYGLSVALETIRGVPIVIPLPMELQ